ncbi:hypothetical protein Ancab_000033 [Ancistrocladus abbreviatus]
MKPLYLTHSLLPICYYCYSIPNWCPAIHSPIGRLSSIQIRPSRFIASLKASDFQDFQGYVKPRRLLPATEVKECIGASPEKIISWFEDAKSKSLYKILLHTSPSYGSGLSDVNAGILVCIIDELGDSILQRIPSSSYEDIFAQDDSVAFDVLHFQRGSVDEFLFQGPELGRVQAMWISVESGRWRLGGANLAVVKSSEHHLSESMENESHYISIQYNFEAQDVMLGEQSDMSMVELRPSQVTECSGVHLLSFLSKPLADVAITKEESMREYANLKFSLLLYDAMLVFSGTSVASFTARENTALAFLTGGVGGFLYLLLLQRSVDRLPAADAISLSKGSNTGGLFGGVKGRLLVLAFVSGFAVLVAKQRLMGDVEILLTPKELVFGMMGFLMCKVAVVLAAVKPLSMGRNNSN